MNQYVSHNGPTVCNIYNNKCAGFVNQVNLYGPVNDANILSVSHK